MPTTEQESTATRRWSAFVCPLCRFVFRIPKDHDGEGIVCPSCHRILRIPGEGEETAPLLAPPENNPATGEESPQPRGEKRRRSKRKKKAKQAKTPGWEASAGKWRVTRKKGKYTFRSIAGWILCMAAVFGAAYVLMKIDEPAKTAAPSRDIDDFEEPMDIPLLPPDEKLETPIELPTIMQRSEAEFLSLAKPIAEAFLASTTVDQILPLVGDRERVEKHIRAYYPDGKIEPTGISRFNARDRVSYKDSFAAVTILTTDFERRELAFVEAADGLKIDWESWIGWSEMPWDKLIESRPTQPVLIRARVRLVDYYNFAFADESKWRSYLLISPDGEHSLYGYTERDSLLDQRLRPSDKNATVTATLKIRFPADGVSRNQVLIGEYIADGWLISEQRGN